MEKEFLERQVYSLCAELEEISNFSTYTLEYYLKKLIWVKLFLEELGNEEYKEQLAEIKEKIKKIDSLSEKEFKWLDKKFWAKITS